METDSDSQIDRADYIWLPFPIMTDSPVLGVYTDFIPSLTLRNMQFFTSCTNCYMQISFDISMNIAAFMSTVSLVRYSLVSHDLGLGSQLRMVPACLDLRALLELVVSI